MINRRELIRAFVLLSSYGMLGGLSSLTACSLKESSTHLLKRKPLFDSNELALLDEISETIFPRTDTPGAKDAGVGKFISMMAEECLSEVDQKILKRGVQEIAQMAISQYQNDFTLLTQSQRELLLRTIEQDAITYAKTSVKDQHYFVMIKDLTLLGFFTSEVGAAHALRFLEVPGRYVGCTTLAKGQTAWSTDLYINFQNLYTF